MKRRLVVVAADRGLPGRDALGQRQRAQLQPQLHAAVAGHVGGVGGQPVAQVDHRRGPGRGERAALAQPRPGPQVALHERREEAFARFEQPAPGLRAAQLAGHAHQVPGSGAACG